jgi:molybdopterin-binding protein
MNKIVILPVLIITLFTLFSCGSRSNPTGGPEDLEKPAILASVPAQYGQIENGRIEITFSKPIDKTSVTQAIYIYPPVVNKKITVDKSTLMIRFNEPLRQDTNYYVTVSTRLKDIRGNSPQENQTLVFANGKLNQLRLSGNVSYEDPADKSLPIQLSLLSSDSLMVMNQASPGPAYVLAALNPDTYILRAFIDKDNNNRYDFGREPYWQQKVDVFQSATLDIGLAYADSTRPTIKLAQAKHLREVELTFSESLSGYGPIKLYRTDNGDELPVILSSLVGDKMVLLTQAQDAQAYNVEARNIRDLKGNLTPLARGEFRSSQVIDTASPVVVSSIPRTGTSVNDLQPILEIHFSEIIPSASLKAVLKASEAKTDTPLDILSADGSVYRFKPSKPLQNYRSYVLTVSAADISGNKLKEDFKLNFLPLLRSQ